MPRRLSSPPSELPQGFLYKSDFLSPSEETALLGEFRSLHFEPFDFRGYKARRRVVEYGWQYDFSSREASEAREIPSFLTGVRDRAAAFAALEPEALVEAVVTEYSPGSPIGWHRDVPQFEVVVGISLAGSCRMRFKPYRHEGKIASIVLEPRSIYVLTASARWKFQHSIPAVEALRYSITFRTLREKERLGTVPIPPPSADSKAS